MQQQNNYAKQQILCQSQGAALQQRLHCRHSFVRQQRQLAAEVQDQARTRKHSQGRRCVQVARAVVEAAALKAEDKWIEKALHSLHRQDIPDAMSHLQQESIVTLETQRMPTLRNEEYRYTDVSLLLRTTPEAASGAVDADQVQEHQLADGTDIIRLVLVGSQFSAQLSSIGSLPEGVYVGSLAKAPTAASEHLGRQSRTYGGPFAILNSALAEDVLCIHIPAAVELEKPIHVLYLAPGSSSDERLSVANPRLLVQVGKRASCQVVEEFAAANDGSRYFTNAVAEVRLEEGASINHGYVELEGKEAWHMKASLIYQAASSRYQLTEAQLGGMLSRHDLSIQQAGPDTETVMRSFLLCGPSQLHDLHSKLRLEHPRGVANQLHKCIVSASSGRGVFDGNVKVERFAQQTDAAQLSRNLLIAPKATVNVKPNLQIVADDVKCSHGCAISDLEEEQLFYFRTRGIDDATARQVLVYSFGSEVTQHFKHEALLKRIQERINGTLALARLS